MSRDLRRGASRYRPSESYEEGEPETICEPDDSEYVRKVMAEQGMPLSDWMPDFSDHKVSLPPGGRPQDRSAAVVRFVVEGEWVEASDIIGHVITDVRVKDRTIVVVARAPEPDAAKVHEPMMPDLRSDRGTCLASQTGGLPQRVLASRIRSSPASTTSTRITREVEMCTHKIMYGNGHQGTAYCRETGEHDLHCAETTRGECYWLDEDEKEMYGEMWASTGFFDNSPRDESGELL